MTASSVGALFSCHPYASALKLYCEKKGVEFEQPDDKVLRRGRWLEPSVALAVSEKRPDWKITPANCYLRDPKIRLGCTPDFFIDGDERGCGVLQTKTCAPHVFERDWDQGREPPLWIVLQTSVEAMLADAAFAAIAVLIVDPFAMDVHVFEFERNRNAEEKIVDAVREFWADVENGREPEPDYGRDGSVIRALTQEVSRGKTIDLSGHNQLPELLALRASLKRRISENESRCGEIENEIKLLMRDAEAISGIANWKITFKEVSTAEYTVKARKSRQLRIYDKRPETVE